MDIFSLISTNQTSHFFHHNNFTGELSVGTKEDEELLPPRRTPRRLTNHVDKRVQTRRSKLCTSSHSSTGWISDNDSLSDDHLLISSSAVILSSSSLHIRLNRAKIKREQILADRVQSINARQHRFTRAEQRKEENRDTLVQKAKENAYCKVIQAKERRHVYDSERRRNAEVSLKEKEKKAIHRKETVVRHKITKARTHDSLQFTKERRAAVDTTRATQVEASLEWKIMEAQTRFQNNLYEKQRRASRQDRKDRAERRRKLLSYERRALLLASLDTKLLRATERNEKLRGEIATKAGQVIERAREVSRKVRAARIIQKNVRKWFGFDDRVYRVSKGGSLKQNDAAGRLQRWSHWRISCCKHRFFRSIDSEEEYGINNFVAKMCEGLDKTTNSNCTYSNGVEALSKLLEIFPTELLEEADNNSLCTTSHIHRRTLTFDQLRKHMIRPDTIVMVKLILDCLRPALFFSTCRRAEVDGRTFLSLLFIAIHPRDVLGENSVKTNIYEKDDRSRKGCRMLLSSCQRLLIMLHELLPILINDKSCLKILKSFATVLLTAVSLFDWWKAMDLQSLLDEMAVQLEQSWTVYLTSSQSLTYIVEISGINSSSRAQSNCNDPLVSVRLRHEAARAGSRSHIKRIRISPNKMVGSDEGKEIVQRAKAVALRRIEESSATQTLRNEIDDMSSGLFVISASRNMPFSQEPEDTKTRNRKDQMEMAELTAGLSNDLLTNVRLIHRILLTDPEDFEKLSWDDTNIEHRDITPHEYMLSFLLKSTASQPTVHVDMLTAIQMHVSHSMKMAFLQRIAQEMVRGNFVPLRDLLTELIVKMRALVPKRKDLHSHVNDNDVAKVSSVNDAIRVIIKLGSLLANYLESPARAPTTHDIVECLAKYIDDDENCAERNIPFGIENDELLAVASVGFILHKTELCQKDIADYKLVQTAPLLYQLGYEFELAQFQKSYGKFDVVSGECLRMSLPSTYCWIQNTRELFASEQPTVSSTFDQKMDFIKNHAFVDGLLFTRNQLVLPEVFSLDLESINNIRDEARCCVIASALALHACNISKVGLSVLSSDVISDAASQARDELLSILRLNHANQESLEMNVSRAAVTLTEALAGKELSSSDSTTLQNHVIAVLNANDPVLKLLNHRIQSFFRFACLWRHAQTIEMKTGKKIVKGVDAVCNNNHRILSTKKEFSQAAYKEASRQGFAFFGMDLVNIGDTARRIISLACGVYGHNIFYPLLISNEDCI